MDTTNTSITHTKYINKIYDRATEIEILQHKIGYLEAKFAALERFVQTIKKEPKEEPQEWYTRQELMEKYRIKKDKFYELLHNGKIDSITLGANTKIYKANFI